MRRSGVFIVNFEHISHLFLVFLFWYIYFLRPYEGCYFRTTDLAYTENFKDAGTPLKSL